MSDDLVDRIYEAALVPERWPSVLLDVGQRCGSVSGAVLCASGNAAPLWRSTDLIEDVLQEFVSRDLWRTCERPRELMARNYPGFLCMPDYLTAEQIARDQATRLLGAIGLGWQLASLVAMPSGEAVAFTFERRLEDGKPDTEAVALIDALRPHLARAALLSARLGLDRARAAVATLEAVGLPAAVATEGGRVLAANDLFETSTAFFRPAAYGRLMLAHPGADELFRERLDADVGGGQSIPVPGNETRPAAIVHLLPLRGAAHDIFSGAAILVVLTTVSMTANVPDIVLLRGLFDLTPKEAKLATALASGRSLKEAASDEGIRFSTARSYLEEILRKTGTRQQSQLVALLKSARSPRSC